MAKSYIMNLHAEDKKFEKKKKKREFSYDNKHPANKISVKIQVTIYM